MDLFRLLHAVLYGTETPVYSKYLRECSLHVSGHNLPAACQRHTLVPLLNSGANAAPA